MDSTAEYQHVPHVPRIEVHGAGDQHATHLDNLDYNQPLSSSHSTHSSPHLSWERRRLYLPPSSQPSHLSASPHLLSSHHLGNSDDNLHLSIIPEASSTYRGHHGHQRSRSLDLGQAALHQLGSQIYPPRPAQSSHDLTHFPEGDLVRTGRSIVR
ncbi:hypothetical protein ACOMHN_048529 [Nucella lapillus]